MNPYLQDILHNITTRLAKLEEAQVKKEWVGLTYEDMIEVWNGLYKGGEVLPTTFGMAIEAKLKEKNT
jgi:hypothetical protein